MRELDIGEVHDINHMCLFIKVSRSLPLSHYNSSFIEIIVHGGMMVLLWKAKGMGRGLTCIF